MQQDIVFLYRPLCVRSQRGKSQVYSSHSTFVHSLTLYILSLGTSTPSLLSQKTFCSKAVSNVVSSLQPCPFTDISFQFSVHCFFWWPWPLAILLPCSMKSLSHKVLHSHVQPAAWEIQRSSAYMNVHTAYTVKVKCLAGFDNHSKSYEDLCPSFMEITNSLEEFFHF